MKVQDVMTSEVKSCRPETSLAAAAVMMLDYDCGALPVVNDENKVIGMITDRDIAIAAATRPRLASEIPVGEVISHKVYSAMLDEDIHAALKTMQKPDGKMIQGPMLFMQSMWSQLEDKDIKLVAGYIKKLPPVKNKVPKSTFKPHAGPPGHGAGGRPGGPGAGSGSAELPAGSGAAKAGEKK